MEGVSSFKHNIQPGFTYRPEILERTNHSMPVSYVPLGQDATVNYNVIDLKFKNNTGGFYSWIQKLKAIH